jgi:hypothetical protein
MALGLTPFSQSSELQELVGLSYVQINRSPFGKCSTTDTPLEGSEGKLGMGQLEEKEFKDGRHV